MRRSSGGFTLTEILVALGIAAGVSIYAARQLVIANRFSLRAKDQYLLNMGKLDLAREVHRAFDRGRGISVAGFAGGMNTVGNFARASLGQAPAVPNAPIGFPAVAANTAFAIAADLRPCPVRATGGAAFFNPGDPRSNDTGANRNAHAAAFTTVLFGCCRQGGPAYTVPQFPGVLRQMPRTAANACVQGPGLTVAHIGPGAAFSSKCYGQYSQRGMVAVNSNEQLTFGAMRLVNAGLNQQATKRQFQPFNSGGGMSATYSLRNALYGSGFLYYLQFISNDGASDHSPAANVRLLAGDVGRVTEFYETLGNFVGPHPAVAVYPYERLISCGRGVQD